jgi:adenine-specific DNA glycosylase
MRRRYHVNLVVHGQRVCSPQHPRCGACPAAIVCRKRGLPSQVSDSLASRVERLHLSRSAEREASGRSVRREDRRSIVPTMAVAR